jgi:hypothetical protein
MVTIFYCLECCGEVFRFTTLSDCNDKVDQLHIEGKLSDMWVERRDSETGRLVRPTLKGKV